MRDNSFIPDVLIIGSGAAGAIAADTLLKFGKTVVMLDFGNKDEVYQNLIPNQPFTEIRRDCIAQRDFFLGRNLEGIPTSGVRVGSQLTPPRQYIARDVEKFLPLESESFFPLQSLAYGGLSVGWGASSFCFDESELEQIGLPSAEMQKYYDAVSETIGISADLSADTHTHCHKQLSKTFPALSIDANAEQIIATYQQKRALLNKSGFFLGRSCLAALSAPYKGRAAHAYTDLDFWADHGRSVFRAQFLVDELRNDEKFSYVGDRLVLSFQENESNVEVKTVDRSGKNLRIFKARRLILCGGALGSARIAANSFALERTRTPLLSNEYTYLPCLHWPMLGSMGSDRRHSLAQLFGVYKPDAKNEHLVSLQFYSYRSLLLFKLIKETPLPAWAGKLLWRTLVESLVIIGTHFSDSFSKEKYFELYKNEREHLPRMAAHYKNTDDELRYQTMALKRIKVIARKLKCLPLGAVRVPSGGAIHYAGTIPYGTGEKLNTDFSDRLARTQRVYVGDSSSWRYLPAKGPTFTIMAHSARVASKVAEGLD